MMTPEQQLLWQRIRQYDLDEAAVAFPFSARLARENGWGWAFALRAIEEYKRFMFLVCAADSPLTPSDAVDQVWHLHLLYTESYWNVFCAKTLGRQIHHGPTKGGSRQRATFQDTYAATQALYRKFFGPPPSDIWPESAVRFGETDFQRINLHRYWAVPKPIFLLNLWKNIFR